MFFAGWLIKAGQDNTPVATRVMHHVIVITISPWCKNCCNYNAPKMSLPGAPLWPYASCLYNASPFLSMHHPIWVWVPAHIFHALPHHPCTTPSIHHPAAGFPHCGSNAPPAHSLYITAPHPIFPRARGVRNFKKVYRVDFWCILGPGVQIWTNWSDPANSCRDMGGGKSVGTTAIYR
jgi:hypothetical protein